MKALFMVNRSLRMLSIPIYFPVDPGTTPTTSPDFRPMNHIKAGTCRAISVHLRDQRPRHGNRLMQSAIVCVLFRSPIHHNQSTIKFFYCFPQLARSMKQRCASRILQCDSGDTSLKQIRKLEYNRAMYHPDWSWSNLKRVQDKANWMSCCY